VATAGVALEGGGNDTVIPLADGDDDTEGTTDFGTFTDALEGIKFNAVALPSSEQGYIDALITKIKALRENAGKGVVGVISSTTSPDYEGIINVTNGVYLGEQAITPVQATAWVAAASAAAGYTQSTTYWKYDGATAVNGVKTNEETIAAINKGEFIFSLSEAGEVVVEYDINTLTSWNKPKDKTYRKNRVIRVFDAFQEAIQLNFPPNKFDNSPEGWAIMEGIGKSRLSRVDRAGAIHNVDYANDFLVDRSLSTGDEVYFNVGLEAVDSAEKLYFTIKTR
jgi:hypothetical protein